MSKALRFDNYFSGQHFIKRTKRIVPFDENDISMSSKSFNGTRVYDLSIISRPLTPEEKTSELLDEEVRYEGRVAQFRDGHNKMVYFYPIIIRNNLTEYDDDRLKQLPSLPNGVALRNIPKEGNFYNFFGTFDTILRKLASRRLKPFHSTEAYLEKYYDQIINLNSPTLAVLGDLLEFKFYVNNANSTIEMKLSYNKVSKKITLSESNGVITSPIRIRDITIINEDKKDELVKKLLALETEFSSKAQN